jgi:PAS domain S-box-containing protein
MTNIKIFLKLTVIMAVVSIGAVSITTGMLYLDEFREHQEILKHIADRQRRLIESIITYNTTHTAADHIRGDNYILSETVKILEYTNREVSHSDDIEVVTAVKDKDNDLIVFISHNEPEGHKNPTIIKVGSPLAIPMQRALEGKAGVTRSTDYNGDEVLAAYTYVNSVKLGVVAKARISAVSNRFVKGAFFAAMPALVLVLLGVYLFFRMTTPVIERLRKENKRYRELTAERLVVAKKLEEKEHRLQCFYDAAFEGIAITRDGIFVDSNKRFAKMFGHEPHEIIGMQVVDLVHEADRDIVARNIQTGYAKPYEHRAVQKNQKIVDVEVHGAQTIFRGEPARITVVHDITERNQYFKQLAEINRRQVMTSKMEAIGNFASGIAHDFNNSLTPIIGNCDLLMLNPDRSHDDRDKILKILAAAETAAALVRRIQSFTRRGADAEIKQPLKIDDCIQEAFLFLRSITPMSIRMELNVEKSIGLVSTTDVMIRQILMNLVKNAAHAMENEQGVIKIDVGKETILVERFGINAGKYVRIDVIDDGCGMPKEVLERAVDPYFTTKSDKSGTGLGLAVVNGILESHKGLIHLQSAEGLGTTVSIYLPSIEDNGQALDYCDIDEPLPQGNGQHILFVDDEKSIVDMAGPLLSSLNYKVTGFTDSTEALKTFYKDPSGYDVLMSDMTMPGITGIALVQKVKEINPEIKVILNSGFGDNGRFKADVLSHKIDIYMQKPVTIRQYAEALEKILVR